MGRFIRKAEGAVHFWIGDWLNYGESHYGETYTQAIDETGYEYQTLANDKWLSNKFELSRRRENLTQDHYKSVASLPTEEQDKLLEIAEKENVKREEFRKLIKDHKKALLPKPVIPDGEFNVIKE